MKNWVFKTLLFSTISLGACTDAHQGKVGTRWPAGLNVVGFGFPDTGDACRQLNETAAISGYVEKAHMFIGCPEDVSEALMNKINTQYFVKELTVYEGIKILAIPLE